MERGKTKLGLRKFIFGRYRRLAPVRAIAREAEKILKAYNNQDYAITRNGETRVIERIARLDRATTAALLDVGAHLGEWTEAARREFKAAPIHAFELVPYVHGEMAGLIGALPNVTLNAFGLAERAGTFRVPFSVAGAHLTSLEEIPGLKTEAPVEVRVDTGDAYLARTGIERVLMLKIDVEGSELRVMKGFERALTERRIDVLQFEYNVQSIASRTLLKDFYQYLEPKGYRLGKVFPTYVEFGPYTERLEDFKGPNFVAAGSWREDIIRALS